ncbi:MAG: inorganic phosphate transporter [Chloroflexi bacterium]|nr:inorganic phosphate transporter [Chloroflexota bacterium]
MGTTPGLALVLGTAFVFAYVNGLNDSANAVATLISTRAMAPRRALLMAAAGELIGPFAFGSAVAATMGNDLLKPEALTPAVLFAALLSAVAWGLLGWYLGLPSSSSHALVGGLVGGALAAIGTTGFRVEGLLLVVLYLLLSPLLGLILGYVMLRALLAILAGAAPGVNVQLRRLQLFTAFALALGHGSNDGQKSIGVMAASLVAFGAMSSFVIPWWVVALAALGLALGTAVGGQRLIRTLGVRIYRIRPVHGFAAQGPAALVVLASALLGGPVSASQVMASAIMGVGIAESVSRVRWRVAVNIFLSWALVLPATAAGAALLYQWTRTLFAR